MADWKGGASGAMSGAAAGATYGSIVPGIGTGIGAGVGAIAGGLMGLFKKKPGAPGSSATGPSQGGYDEIMGKYRDFSNTGGYSDADKANMRSRAVSPLRAVYANANRGVTRQRALQGGYSPGYTSAMTRMAREQSQGLSDANINVEAELAEMTQKGRLAGVGGMLNTEQSRLTTPSDYSRKLDSIGKTSSMIGQGAGALATVFGNTGGVPKPKPVIPSSRVPGAMSSYNMFGK